MSLVEKIREKAKTAWWIKAELSQIELQHRSKEIDNDKLNELAFMRYIPEAYVLVIVNTAGRELAELIKNFPRNGTHLIKNKWKDDFKKKVAELSGEAKP